MRRSRGQGAIESACGPTAGTLSGQGATEYLVLLAVVLVIGLVGIALLGFFPGTASEAQLQESEIYWKSASPIAVVEWGTGLYPWTDYEASGYLRLRNVGAYPIRITKLLGDGDEMGEVLITSDTNLSSIGYMAPGEEFYIGSAELWSVPQNRHWEFIMKSRTPYNHALAGATQICNPRNDTNKGIVVVRNFGFEYIQYVEGQEITKRQIGTKPLMIRCKQ